MNPALLHLALNHFPLFGALVGGPILGLGLYQKSLAVKKMGLWLVVTASLSAIPVYFSGEPAEEIVEHKPGVSESVVKPHEEAAERAVIFMEITGALSLVILVLLRLEKTVPNVAWGGVLALTVVSLLLMAQTAHLGGMIRHDELRGPVAAGVSASEKESEHSSSDD